MFSPANIIITGTIIGLSILFLLLSSTYPIFGQIDIYTNEEYGIEMKYPTGWTEFGDAEAGYYTTDIATFVAPDVKIKFKEFDYRDDFYKFTKRICIQHDYSFVIPKLNLHFALDNTMDSLRTGDDIYNIGFTKCNS